MLGFVRQVRLNNRVVTEEKNLEAVLDFVNRIRNVREKKKLRVCDKHCSEIRLATFVCRSTSLLCAVPQENVY